MLSCGRFRPGNRSCSPIRRDEGDQRERNVAAVFRVKEKLPLTAHRRGGGRRSRSRSGTSPQHPEGLRRRRTCTPTAKSTARLPARSILDGDFSAAAPWQALSRVVAGGSCGRGKRRGPAMAWWLGREKTIEARGRRDMEKERVGIHYVRVRPT